LDSNYSNYVDSRLVSPPFLICPPAANPVLRFWHWYFFTINDNDFGRVQIRVVGDTDWDTLAEYHNHGGGIWTQPYIPIPSDYAGQIVEIAFYFHSDNSYVAPGWYIDNIELQGLTPLISYAPLSKYSPPICSAMISINAKDPCGGDLYYNYSLPEGCSLIGNGSQVEIDCIDAGPEPYEMFVSVESETSHIASQDKTISIFTQVKYDENGDSDIDGADLRQYVNAGVFDDLERLAMEFGLIACQ
jgi:hypothetical protein